MRGNPSGNFVPECEPRKGVSWRLTELDAKSNREDSAGSSDTPSLVLGSIFYTKPPGFTQGGNQKSYLKWTTGIWGLRPFGAQDGFGRGRTVIGNVFAGRSVRATRANLIIMLASGDFRCPTRCA